MLGKLQYINVEGDYIILRKMNLSFHKSSVMSSLKPIFIWSLSLIQIFFSAWETNSSFLKWDPNIQHKHGTYYNLGSAKITEHWMHNLFRKELEAYHFHQMVVEKTAGSKWKQPSTLHGFNSKLIFHELYVHNIFIYSWECWGKGGSVTKDLPSNPPVHTSCQWCQ